MALSKIPPSGQTQYAGVRNLIINGAMQVAQRGTSSTGITNGNSGYHTVDRFRFVEQGSPTYQVTLTQSTEAPTGFSNSFKYDVTTAQSSLAAGDVMSCDTIVEAQDLQHLNYGTSSAKSITLSFWVRSNLTGTYNVWFYQDDDAREATKTYTIDTADTWEHKTITISGDQTGVIDNNNGRGIFIRWHLASGTTYTGGTANKDWGSSVNADRAAGLNVNMASSTSNEWYLTGVQLEVGDKATDFEHRSFHDEAQRCKRYYEVLTNYVYSTAYSAQSLGNFWFTVEKRTNCTLTADTNSGGLDLTWSPAGSGNTHGGYIYENPAGWSAVAGIRGDAEL